MPLFVQDTFTDVAGTSLVAHTGELGATWTKHPINPNGAEAISTIGTSRNNALQISLWYASGVPPTADYYVEADFNFQSIQSNNALAINARENTVASTFYSLRYSSTSNGWFITKTVNGTQTSLVSLLTPATAGTIRRGRLVVAGNLITAYLDGTQILQVTDTSITAAGVTGFQRNGTGAFGDAVGMHMDNFSAGTLDVAYTGTGSLSGSGTISGSGVTKLAVTRTGSLSGSGTLSTAATVSVSTTAMLSGTGAVSGAGTANLVTVGTGALNGSGALTGTGTALVNVSATATLAGTGTLTSAATITVAGNITLTGTGTLFAVGLATLSAEADATLTGTGTLSGAGSATIAVTGTAVLGGDGTLSGDIVVGLYDTVNLTGTGTLQWSHSNIPSRNITVSVRVFHRNKTGRILDNTNSGTIKERRKEGRITHD